jgi:hypothetical protein
MRSSLSISLASFWRLPVSFCSARFTGNVQGVVQDSSGAGVAKATVRIVNRDTQSSATANSADSTAKIFECALALDPGNAQERRLVAPVELMAHHTKAAIAALEPLQPPGK